LIWRRIYAANIIEQLAYQLDEKRYPSGRKRLEAKRRQALSILANCFRRFDGEFGKAYGSSEKSVCQLPFLPAEMVEIFEYLDDGF
jgi:hypothetical protein